MKRFQLRANLQYCSTDAATYIFNISAMRNAHQEVRTESLRITPELPSDAYVCDEDQSRYFRVNLPGPGTLEVNYASEVSVEPYIAPAMDIQETPAAELPLDVIPFLYPSRYCESDRLNRLALVQFGHLLSGYSRVQGICNWIYDNVMYLSGSTSSNTSAFNTVTERAGVCRDFAHLGIAFCRALGVPARFVSGYAIGLDPPDFHAIFEAYLDGHWYLFDATRLVSLDAFVRVGTGHDASDVSFATIFGPTEMTQMQLSIESSPTPFFDTAVSAISTTAR